MLTQIRARLPRLRDRTVAVGGLRQNATSISETKCDPETKNARRFNPIGVQMLSPALHRQVFGDVSDKLDREAVQRSVQHLKEQKLWGPQQRRHYPKSTLSSRPFAGLRPRRALLGARPPVFQDYRLAADVLGSNPLPRQPPRWSFAPGWTKYSNDGKHAVAVDYPYETSLVFDVEVCMREGHFSNARDCRVGRLLVLWCSPQLVGERFRWKERYAIEGRSPEILGHPVASHVRVGSDEFPEGSIHGQQSSETAARGALPSTLAGTLSSLNNLADVYKLYSGGRELKRRPGTHSSTAPSRTSPKTSRS
ncbi:hypothetical protein HPB52_021008 [Rhipicephalus sanguineus]|uniref:DNA mitochondrial polymerase exonuclease domain-containing protein n=1 Tax=Rhipicephalus sanguineus TaxID=34632 RepID=A0A9D4QC14_RHISA|nr:hypothetical protein HPB52_021008 [Rhipicephalus sanguineus]